MNERSLRRQLGSAVAATMLFLVVASVAPAVSAGAAPVAGGFTVRPAHADPDDPATQAYFKQELVAGQAFVDQIVIGNVSDAPITFDIAPVDGLTAQTSGAVYANSQDDVTKAGDWAAVDASHITIAPQTEQTVGFTVTAPDDAAPGDHLLGLSVQNAEAKTSGGSFQVKQMLRVVVGVLIRVPGTAAPHLRVERAELRELEGPNVGAVIVRLGDDGTTLFKPKLTVTLSGPRGYERTVSRQLDTLLPGDMIDYPLSWPDDLTAGHYDITAEASYDGVSVQVLGASEVRENLVGTDSPGSEPVATRPTSTGSNGLGLVIVIVGSVVLTFGLLGAFGMIRRPRRDRTGTS